MTEITFRSLQPDLTSPPPNPHEGLLPNFNPKLPPDFIHAAEQAAGYMIALDQDPEIALQQPQIKTFVQELGGSGFVGGVHLRHELGGPDPKQALPAWLQSDFLETHGLTTPGISDTEKKEIGELFNKAVGDRPFFDSAHGRYYGEQPSTSLDPRQFKYYVESQELLAMLREGKFENLLGALEGSRSVPKLFKLYENDRLVLYFDGTVNEDDVHAELSRQGIAGRGPAQDVFQVSEENDEMFVKVFASNDAALGDGGRNPIEYAASTYDPRAFVQAYLQHCLFSGKNPAEPYKTSFIYLISPDSSVNPKTIEAAQRFTHYPVVVASSRRELSLIA